MKTKISSLIILVIIFNILISLFGNISFAVQQDNVETEKKNSESYWSTKNAPIFYGTTKVTLQKGMIDEFNILDSRFRIFAKDFEDGDLTSKITYSGEVNVEQVGEYTITYKVTDSHNNKTEIQVPIIVTDNQNDKITVEKTLYTTPSVWNMDLAGFSRCNYGDRQMLGVFIGANQSVQARILSADGNLSVAFLNNNSQHETTTTIPANGNWVTLQNKKNGTGYDSVPLIKTTVLSKDNTQINKTYKIELKYDETIKPVDYYHYLDNEENFRTQWNISKNSYGIIESETLIIVAPFADLPYMTNYHKNGFSSLDKFLEYYQKVVEKMDEYIGLDFNPEKITDQNVRTKYLVKANSNGAGAAYYAGDHVGINNASMKSFFEMNWGGLHELAHGYQGTLGKGEMQLGEVANNIIGHYIQIDKNIYTAQGDWLGKLPNIEERKNAGRLSGKTFLEQDTSEKLYFIVNLFDRFEGGTTYSKIFSWYREQLNKGRKITNQDAYVEAISNIYHVNVIPYMEAWGLTISEQVKANVYVKNDPFMYILKDMLTENTLQTVMQEENLDKKYGLVTNEILHKYNITGDITLNINIDNIDKIKGKVILLKQGNDIIKSIKVDTNKLQIKDIPVGTYYLQMPIINGYLQNYAYISVKEDSNNTYTYTYKNQKEQKYNNYLMIRLLGYSYDTIAYQITFKDNYTKAEIKYPNQSSMSGNESVIIYNENGEIVTQDVTTGGYFDYNKGTHEIKLKPGYKIQIKYPNKYANKVVAYNTLNNVQVPEYNALKEITTYTVIDGGIIKEGMTEKQAQDLEYLQLKNYLIKLIEEYKETVTEKELNNKYINFQQKANVINAYENLKKQDKTPYKQLINSILKGGTPTILLEENKLEYKVGTQINLYSFIKAIDNEDGNIEINTQSTIIQTNLNQEQPGKYEVTYQVSDSDNNIATKTITINMVSDEQNPGEGETPKPPTEDNKPTTPPSEDDKPTTPPSEDDKPTTPPDGENKPITPPNQNQDEDELGEIDPPSNLPNQEQEEITTPQGDTTITPDKLPQTGVENNKDIVFKTLLILTIISITILLITKIKMK